MQIPSAKFNFTLRPLALLSLAVSVTPAVAQNDSPGIEEIVVNADRIPVFNDTRVTAAEGAQMISSEYIRAQQATTLADALRKTTSIQVDEEGGNQGSVVIVRGLQGDQVSVRVDGAPQNFNQVRHGGANTIWAEPDMYKSITVIPGVASNIYGNGSIGGVVKLETKDPSDVIPRRRDWGVNVRMGYESNGNGRYLSSENAYMFTEDLSGLLHVVSRESSAYEDGNGNETLGGATGSEDMNILAKLNFNPSPAHNLELTRQSMNKEYVARGTQSRGRVVSSTDQFTEVVNDTMAVQYGFAPQDNFLIDANIRYSRNESDRDRRNGSNADFETWGSVTDYLEIENTSLLNQSGRVQHALRYGVDYTRDDLVTAYTDLGGNQIARQRDIYGAYISDSIQVGPKLSLVASVRWDSYEARDAIDPVVSENTAVSPNLHVNYSPFTTGWESGITAYGLVGRGFRAPSVHETFGRGATGVVCDEGRRGFACTEMIPNSTLDAEVSDSWESGVRYHYEGLFSDSDQLRVQVGYINNNITDFIDQQELARGEIEINGRDFAVDRSTFVNINDAEIKGWEYSLNYTSERWFTAVTAQTMDGRDLATGQNLRDVSPHSINASLGAYLFDGKSRVGIDMTRRDDREVDEDSAFNRLGYTIYDLFGSYQLNDRFLLQVRAENLLDELYTKRFQNLSIDPDTGDQQDVTYYQPGRNIKVTLEMKL